MIYTKDGWVYFGDETSDLTGEFARCQRGDEYLSSSGDWVHYDSRVGSRYGYPWPRGRRRPLDNSQQLTSEYHPFL